jgi:hypothetical protein
MRMFAMSLAMLAGLIVPAAAKDCLKVKEIKTSYDALRQGSSMKVRMKFESASDCVLPPIKPANSKQQDYALDLVASPGLSFRVVGFGVGKPEPRIAGFHQFEMTLQVEAALGATLRSRQIPAFLHFIAEDANGISGRTLAFSLPVQLVPSTAAVKERSIYQEPRPFTPADVLLIPVRILNCVGEILQKGNCGS